MSTFPGFTEPALYGRGVIQQSFEITYNSAAQTFSVPVPAGSLVFDVAVVVTTAFNATTPTLTVGDGSDPDGYLDDTDIGLATAATATTPAVKLARNSSNPYANGKYYAEADTIDFVFDPGTLDASPTGKLKGTVLMVNLANDIAAAV